MTTLAALHSLVDIGAGAPEWVHLVPAGTFRGADGRGPYRLADAAGVIAASMAGGNKLPIDENHATDLAGPAGAPSPARGWIVEMQARVATEGAQSREDGLWGRVEWTPTGQTMMTERAYRGISPVFQHDKAGVVLRVLRAALTNTPNLPQLTSLHHQQETGMDLAQLRAALGLPEGADEAAILAAIRANASAVAAHAQQITAIATAAGITATSADGLVTALQAQRANAADSDRLATQVVSLQTELQTLKQGQARDRATAFVDGAIRAGKPINPLRDRYITRHMADAEGVETEVNALPSINAGGVDLHARRPADKDGDELTPEELATAAKMGIDPAKMAAHKKKMREASDAGNAGGRG